MMFPFKLRIFEQERIRYYSEKLSLISPFEKIHREEAEKPGKLVGWRMCTRKRTINSKFFYLFKVKGLQYKNYIEEKRKIEKEFEVETLERLKRIKEKLNQKNEAVQTNDKKQPTQEQQKRSLKSLVYYYISFGYWNSQQSETTPKKD